MKKLTKKSLNELAKVMPQMSENMQSGFIGGGNGSRTDPYTYDEYYNLLSSGYFPGGYVDLGGNSGIVNLSSSYGCSGVEIVSYNPNNFRTSGIASYDLMYRGGFEIGFNAGISSGNLDDLAVLLLSGVAIMGAGDEPGGTNYDPLWYSMGIRDGLRKGREAMGY